MQIIRTTGQDNAEVYAVSIDLHSDTDAIGPAMRVAAGLGEDTASPDAGINARAVERGTSRLDQDCLHQRIIP